MAKPLQMLLPEKISHPFPLPGRELLTTLRPFPQLAIKFVFLLPSGGQPVRNSVFLGYRLLRQGGARHGRGPPCTGATLFTILAASAAEASAGLS